jgi:signal transduction histidine kinase/CheY-like chemotaxis protein
MFLNLAEKSRAHWQRFLIAFAVVGMAVVFRVVFLKALDNRIPYLTFYPAVTVAALFGGLFAGLAATALSAITLAHWLLPGDSVLAMSSIELTAFGVFLASSILVSSIAEALHRSQIKAAQASAEAAKANVRAQLGALQAAILQYLPFDFLVRDRELHCILQSDVSREVWGDLRGKSFEAANIPETIRAGWRKSIVKALAGEKCTLESAVDLQQYGLRQLIRITAPVIQDDQITGALIANIDISMQKQVEEELRFAKKEADAANKTKSAFLANMSHEIRTPLNGVLGMLQLIETTQLDEEQKNYLDTAILSTRRLTRLLTDILDLSRVEAGKLVLEEIEIDTRRFKDYGFALFMAEAKKKGLSLEITIDERLPSRLIGDEARLRQILFNLVGNAIKFTETGSVRVDVQPLPHRKGGMLWVLFCVSDTGIGIGDEGLKSIFEPFVQVEGSYTRSHQGAGLGLSIVRKLVQLIGGEMSTESTEGEGTTFYVSLPFKLPTPEAVSSKETPPEQSAPGRVSPRVLLAEDEEINRRSCQKLLEKRGYTVTVAINGQEALDLLSKDDFDVILMDIQMPVMDGVEATKAIRSSSVLGAKTKIPIIAMTAYAMSGDREKFLAAGMDDYVNKPVDIEALTGVIARAMDTRQAP